MRTRKRERWWEHDATADGLEYEQLKRELGFDELNYEDLRWELFGDALGLKRPEPRASEPTRVTQVGPGRREPPKR